MICRGSESCLFYFGEEQKYEVAICNCGCFISCIYVDLLFYVVVAIIAIINRIDANFHTACTAPALTCFRQRIHCM